MQFSLPWEPLSRLGQGDAGAFHAGERVLASYSSDRALAAFDLSTCHFYFAGIWTARNWKSGLLSQRIAFRNRQNASPRRVNPLVGRNLYYRAKLPGYLRERVE